LRLLTSTPSFIPFSLASICFGSLAIFSLAFANSPLS